MKKVVIINSNFPSKLYRFGLLKYFPASELRFLIPNTCLENNGNRGISDNFCVKKLIEKEQFEIKSLDDQSMNELLRLSNLLSSKFLNRTICGFVLAIKEKCPIILNDELMQEEATKIGINVLTNEGIVDWLVTELYGQGIELDNEIIEMMK